MTTRKDIKMQHLFDIWVAQQVGVDLAIFLKNIAYWVVHNQNKNINFHDGRYWTHNTLQAFCNHFPYWSRRQIERIINNSVKLGYLVKGNYNKNKHDQEKWYTLTEKAHELLILPISPNGEIELTKWGNGNNETVKCINETDSKPDSKPDIKQKRATACSPKLTRYSKDFFPDDKRRSLLSYHAARTFNTESYLLERFETVSIKYKMRSRDWQETFEAFLINEKPKRTYEDEKGQKRRYDNQSINY